ncbi:MAG: hypothetical protein Q8P31_02770 [Bacillota bacterium]|nr:hypothetical protein [Bacillota bacterium]
MHKVCVLFRKDMLTAYRNRLMLLLMLVPLLVAVALRVLVVVAKRYVPWLPPDTETLLAPLVAMTPGFLVGTAAGFGLVTERETRAAVSLRVMPIGRWMFAAYHCGWQAAMTAVLAPLCLWVYGARPASWPETLAVVLALSLSTGVVSMLLGSLAANRIEALAVSKATGVLLLTPGAVFLVSPAAQLAVAWSPWYWAYVGLAGAVAGQGAAGLSLLRWPGYPPAVAALACLVTSIGWTVVSGRRYERAMG